MKTLENGEITQVTFAYLTVFVSKAKCLLITSNIPIICALQQVWILGIQASNWQNANMGVGTVRFYKAICVSLLFKQAKAI